MADSTTQTILDLVRQERDTAESMHSADPESDYWAGRHDALRDFCDVAHRAAAEEGGECQAALLLVDAVSQYATTDELGAIPGGFDSAESDLDAVIIRAREIMAGDR